jgi:hypothetical protein
LLESKDKQQEDKGVVSHPNRHIRDALKYAEEQGWTIRKSGPRAHAWGMIYCGFGLGNAGWRFTRHHGIPKGMREIFNAP